VEQTGNEKRIVLATGTVKFFNAEKGFGQRVEFDAAPARKGEEARNVRVA
jgi:cold shock CspA family protein